MIGVAAGLASQGKVAFASSFAMFATGKAFEQIRQSVCVPELDVKICATHAGLTVGEDGKSHQMLEDVTIMRVLPHMSVIVPADAVEAHQAVLAAAEIAGPVYVRLSRASTPVVFAESYRFEFGKAALLREGRDLAIVAMGVTVAAAMGAAELLAADGVQARVINMSTISPLDEDSIATAARDCGAILTAEEHQQSGGLGDAVAQTVVKHHPVPMDMLGMDGAFGQSGTGDELLAHYGLDAAGIARRAKALFERKSAATPEPEAMALSTQRRDEIAEAARQVRIDTVRMVHAATCGHPGAPRHGRLHGDALHGAPAPGRLEPTRAGPRSLRARQRAHLRGLLLAAGAEGPDRAGRAALVPQVRLPPRATPTATSTSGSTSRRGASATACRFRWAWRSRRR